VLYYTEKKNVISLKFLEAKSSLSPHFQRVTALDSTEQRHQHFKERNGMFEGFLVVVVFIHRYTFRNPRKEIRLDLDDVLAWQTSQD